MLFHYNYCSLNYYSERKNTAVSLSPLRFSILLYPTFNFEPKIRYYLVAPQECWKLFNMYPYSIFINCQASSFIWNQVWPNWARFNACLSHLLYVDIYETGGLQMAEKANLIWAENIIWFRPKNLVILTEKNRVIWYWPKMLYLFFSKIKQIFFFNVYN